MNPITNDTEYVAAIKTLLADLNGRLTTPSGLPISPDEQARFIHTVLYQAHRIVNSEPYLRGKVIEATDKIKEYDKDQMARDIARYRDLAFLLHEALVVCRGLSKADRQTRRVALNKAKEIL